MENIINFPTKAVRDKLLVEKSIKDILDQTTADQKAKEELTKRLLSLLETYQQDYSFDFQLQFPSGVSQSEADKIGSSVKEGFGRFESLIQSHMNKILIERFQTEIKLYFLETKT